MANRYGRRSTDGGWNIEVRQRRARRRWALVATIAVCALAIPAISVALGSSTSPSLLAYIGTSSGGGRAFTRAGTTWAANAASDLPDVGMLAVHGHDVIVRDMRLRNGGDNIRAQYDTAYNIVFDHLSSTGSHDDGISIGYGAHNVTVQYCFLAGNTRSIFIKYGATNNISIHHTWVMKQWIRGPLASQSAFVDFRNNIVEDWVLWGVRYEKSATGNVVNSIFGESAYAKSAFDNATHGMNVTSDVPVYISGVEFRGTATSKALVSAPSALPAAPVNTQSVAAMEPNVRANAGAMPRDAVDQQYINTASGWSVGKERPLRFF
jgi:hypothetical protein